MASSMSMSSQLVAVLLASIVAVASAGFGTYVFFFIYWLY